MPRGTTLLACRAGRRAFKAPEPAGLFMAVTWPSVRSLGGASARNAILSAKGGLKDRIRAASRSGPPLPGEFPDGWATGSHPPPALSRPPPPPIGIGALGPSPSIGTTPVLLPFVAFRNW